MSDFKFYIEQLKSNECQCGAFKKSMKSLCYGCYVSLPSWIQRDLYKRIRNGYEEAYEDAIEFLNK